MTALLKIKKGVSMLGKSPRMCTYFICYIILYNITTYINYDVIDFPHEETTKTTSL